MSHGSARRQLLAASVALLGILASGGSSPHAQGTSQTLLAEPFSGPTTSSQVLTLSTGGPGFPCLTANPAGTPAVSTIPNCGLASPDVPGQGALRFTSIAEQQASGFVAATSLPTAQGLNITFKQYQYGGHGLDGPGSPGGGDGIAFFLAVAPPHPTTIGPQGGALGYAAAGSASGLPGGWLGFGLDAFGNFSNGFFGSPTCPLPAWAGVNPNSITVRGPGHGTDGYCLLASSADEMSDALVAQLAAGMTLRDVDRASSARTIHISITPSDGLFRVFIDDGSGATLATAGALPSSYYDPETGALVNGLPPRITFGFAASTGTATDIHEISHLTATTASGNVPVLGLTKTTSLSAPPSPGEPFNYIITPHIENVAAETLPLTIRVSDTLPAGVSLAGSANGPSWVCTPASNVQFECAYTNPASIPAGTALPAIVVPVALAATVAPGAVIVNTASVISDDAATPVTASNTITVASGGPPPLAISTASMPGGKVSQVYSTSLGATGGTPPYSWSLASGTLPIGLTLSAAGIISGTPTSAGTFNFVVRASDSTTSVTRPFSIVVIPALTITTTSVPSGTQGAAYPSTTLQATGGSGARTWSVSAGGLPAGLTLSSTGVISGTPTVGGTFAFTVRVADTSGGSATRALSVVIATPLSITTTALPSGRAGTAYSASLAATGGVTPYSWTRVSGALPAGLSLSAAGVISGTPTTTQTATFSVRVTDATSATATRAFTIVVSRLTITTVALPLAQFRHAYSTMLQATGGVGALAWTLASGSLPDGVTFAPTGLISGTPGTEGVFRFVVRVTDANGATATQSLFIRVMPVPIVIEGAGAQPPAEVGLPYHLTATANGGTGAFVWTVASGSLPAGLTLSPAGVVSGVPTAAGPHWFWLRATDGMGRSRGALYSIVVAPALAITTTSLNSARTGTPYSATLSRSGGVSPFTWTLAAGALPAGMSLSTTGAIRGTATATGIAHFTVRVTDGLGASVSRALTLQVERPEKAYVALRTLPCAGGDLFNCDSTIGVVETASGRDIKRIALGNVGDVLGIVASPDGKRVFVATYGGTIAPSLYEIDTATDTILRSRQWSSSVLELTMSPDGSQMFYWSGREIHVVDTASLTEGILATIPETNVRALVVSPDGSQLFVVGNGINGGARAEVITLAATGAELRRLTLDPATPLEAAITPNGGRLLVVQHLPATGVWLYQIADISVASNVVADTMSGSSTTPLTLPIVSPDNANLWTLDSTSPGSFVVSQYSLVTNTRTRRVPINGIASGMVLSTATTGAYIGAFAGNYPNLRFVLSRLDVSGGPARPVANISVGNLVPGRFAVTKGGM